MQFFFLFFSFFGRVGGGVYFYPIVGVPGEKSVCGRLWKESWNIFIIISHYLDDLG